MRTPFTDFIATDMGNYSPVANAFELESPLINPLHIEVESYQKTGSAAYQDVSFPNSLHSELEEEVIGTDERTLVTDTLQMPTRWMCAIDIFVDNPKWGQLGEPQLIVNGRATGILIGPRYVLTARHVFKKQMIKIDGESKLVDVKGLTVSPARNGSNSTNPLGKVKSKSFQVSEPYRILRKVSQGGRIIEIPVQLRDDYALIILEKDVADSTHSSMKGALGYWGQDIGVAIVSRFEPAKLQGKQISIIGYPGDTCGKDKYSGSKGEKEKKIAYCENSRSNEWASTQWRSSGLLQADASSTTLLHTADTYEGESGAPICLVSDNKLHLVGVHTGNNDARANEGVRVTRRMLQELCKWINADAGYTLATIKNDTLVVKTRSSARTSKISSESEPEVENFFELFESPYATAQDEQFETSGYVQPEAFNSAYTSLRDMRGKAGEGLYEFDVSAPSPVITDALNKKDWTLALQLAIKEGWRDENELTNLLFFARHPDLPKERIDPKHPKFRQLSEEWSNIFSNEVLKAIQKSAERTDLSVSGEEASEHHKYFRGKNGKKLKQLIEEIAKEVNINPGLLATTMIVESHGRTYIFLLNEKVMSYHVGVDDFYEARSALKARVPSYVKVGWDKTQKPEEHYNDAKTNRRVVKTIKFNTGRDAAFAIAVYLKYFEIRLREEAAKLKGDFDKLPLETRLALNRMAMASGMGGVLPRLTAALAGKDIFIRKAIPVVIYQTQRNATVRIAQAMYLAEWIFGIFVKPTTQPELEEFEEADQEAYYGFDNESIEGSLQYNENENAVFEQVDGEEETRSYSQAATRSANVYMTITGEKQGQIKGSVILKGRENMIAVYKLHHEIIAPRDTASGAATGKRIHKPLVITKEMDTASVRLLNALVSNEKLKQVVINFWKPDGRSGVEINYYRITLTNAAIANLSQDLPNIFDPSEMKLPVLERVEFVYQKIEWSYLVNSPGIAADDWKMSNEFEFHEAVEEAAPEENEMMNEREWEDEEMHELNNAEDESEEQLMEMDEYLEGEKAEDNFFEGFVPKIALPDVRKRIDDYFDKANHEYKTDQGSMVKIRSQFRISNGGTMLSEDAKTKVNKALSGKSCGISRLLIHNAAYGRAKPAEVAKITQCLIDGGELAKLRAKNISLTDEQLIRLLQFEFGIGIDCGGYVQLAFIFAFTGSDSDTTTIRVNLGLKERRGDENLGSLPAKHFEKIDKLDAQTGDMIIMNPRANDDGSIHTVIIVEHTKAGNVHKYLVDASWGFLYGDTASGISRRTFEFDTSTLEWSDIHPISGNKVFTNSIGPYKSHPIKGVYRARQK